VKDKLKRFGLFAQLGENYFFPTIGVAVARYLETNNVEWEDREDWEDDDVQGLERVAGQDTASGP
jgi:hypothetical protein